MAYSFKGAISFGLVYIPITLHAAVKPNDIGFNMLYKKTKQRIKYNKTCEGCPANLSQGDIIKGYEYEKGKYITFTQEEFDKLKTEKDKSIVIESFVNVNEIDPVFYEKSYYVAPAGTGSDKAFSLLLKALSSEKKIGIAKTVLGTKEAVIALRTSGKDLVLNAMHFADEVQQNPFKLTETKINENELKMAKTIISGMAKKLDLSSYKNEYKERLEKAINQKIKGEAITPAKSVRIKKVSNLMEALTESLKELKQKQGSSQKIAKLKKAN